jgi:ABC-2 type transport system permease protein
VGEVLLASVRADEIVLGKLLGIGAAVLVQTVLWMLPLALAVHLGAAGDVEMPTVAERIEALGVLMLGGAFMASLFLTAASVATGRAAQQVVGLLSLLTNIPFFLATQTMTSTPDGVTAHVLSWFPFTAPITTSFRILAVPDSISTAERVGVAAMLAILTVALVRLAARLLRVTLVSAGAPIGLRAALRQSRLG